MSRFVSLAVAGALMVVGSSAFASPRSTKKAKETKLILKVSPAATDIYIDGKKKGTSEKVHELVLTPGAHIVRLVHKLDEHEDQVILKKGSTTTFEWKFEDDRPKQDQNPSGESPGEATPGGEANPGM